VYGWPDVIIVVVAGIMAHQGWKRGFISELGGTIALFAAFVAAFYYQGWWDHFLHSVSGVSLPSAHVIALAAFTILCYALVATVGWAMERHAKDPAIAPIDSFLGALVGIIRTALLFWGILYVALFFPLSGELRNDLHRSFLIRYLTLPNARFDAVLHTTTPWFIRPLAKPIFHRHSFSE
jgi:uncharacterized membrane protein required for colicin V production